MKTKILLYALPALIFTILHLAEAQQAKKIPRIGLLNFGPAERYRRQQPFLAGLRDLGWVEGQNIAIERGYANESHNQLLDIATELVRLRVDVIVALDSVAIRPAMLATATIPIVMVVSGDPVEAGLIDSLARPGGNVTGLSNISPHLAGKRLELLKETVPGVSKVAVLGPLTHEDWKEIAFAALQQKVRLQTLQVREPEEFEKAFEAARTKRAKALIVLHPTTNSYPEKIVSLAAKYRLPAM